MKNSFTLAFSLLSKIYYLPLFILIFTSQTTAFSQSFTNVAFTGSGGAGSALAITGAKAGGFAWGDINNDGCLDLVINTENSTENSRILIADCSDPNNPTFSDHTSSLCKGLSEIFLERCVLLIDLDGDGDLDLTRNSARVIEIYLNNGEANGYTFGVGVDQTPNFSLSTTNVNDPSAADIPGGMNTEGIHYNDYDGDGDLDLIIENHDYGIDLYENDGSANFTYKDPTTIGLPTTASTGDYAASVDFDNDGWVDIIARKENQTDLYRNTGGQFSTGVEIGDADNNNKGGVLFADFDNDGDHDLYWSENGTDQIWLQTGVHSGSFAATKPSGASNNWGEPWLSAGISASGNTDGCAAGDINNDGKIDLFISDASGASFLFINNTPKGGPLSFTRNNLGINVNGNAEGAAFADYDNDGDLDLYLNIDGGANQLWRNNLSGGSSNDYLFVKPLIDLGGGLTRPATGANVIIRDCSVDQASGIRDVPSGVGHGTSPDTRVHFGLPSGPGVTYMVEVGFVNRAGNRTIVRKLFVPNSAADHTITITNTEIVSPVVCGTFPIELLDFDVELNGPHASISWATAWESNSSHFIVERNLNRAGFEKLSDNIPAAGNSSQLVNYQMVDENLLELRPKEVQYRLKQIDLNGSFTYSDVVNLSIDGINRMSVSAFPNPATDQLSISIRSDKKEHTTWQLISLTGKVIKSGTTLDATAGYIETISVNNFPTGIYYLQVISESDAQFERILIMK